MYFQWIPALFVSAACIFTAGCTPEVMPSSGPRTATDPSAVMIYAKQPKKYETLGSVEVPVGGAVRWDANGDATPGYEMLKAKAAALGANGILLKQPETPDLVLVVAGYKGTQYQVPVRRGNPHVAVVQAIYVLEQ